jgi:hypothetical protein
VFFDCADLSVYVLLQSVDPNQLMGSDWSGYFGIDNIGDFAVIVRNSRSETSFLARVEVRSDGASIYVIISADNPEAAPYRIENR